MKIIITCVVALFVTIAHAQLAIGSDMPQFELMNTKKLLVHSDSINAHYLLVDIWASWCVPCRIANKELVKLDKEYNDRKHFQIVGISVDESKTKWMKAVEKDKLEYLQLIDPLGFDSVIAKDLDVQQLPSTFLFDADRKLIAVNPSIEEIETYINPKKH